MHKSPTLVASLTDLNTEQLSLFNKESLFAQKIFKFDPSAVLERLKKLEGEVVLGIDLGGNKAEASLFTISQQGLVKADGQEMKSVNGKGYLAFLEDTAREYRQNQVMVGISSAGAVRGTKLISSVNLPILVEELKEKYDGDFSNLYKGELSLVNDAVSGVIASTLEARIKYEDVGNIILFINGGGIGGAVLTKGEIWATEPGHVKLADSLNKFKQRKLCRPRMRNYICIENVAASGAGIEDLWFKKTGEKLSGEEISQRYQEKNEFAAELYESSSLICAHAIVGISKVFTLFEKENDTLIFCHGGIFNVPGYAEGLKQILEKHFGFDLRFICTKDLGKNLSLYGAGIAAAINLT